MANQELTFKISVDDAQVRSGLAGLRAAYITLTEKGGLVESLWHAVDNAAGNLENVPGLVRRVIETEAWRKRIQDGEEFEHDRFIDFITTKPLAGCGWPLIRLKR